MGIYEIIGIVAGAVGAVLVLALVLFILSGRKRAKKLQENVKKYQKESEMLDNAPKSEIQLSSDNASENVANVEDFSSPSKNVNPIVEEYSDDEGVLPLNLDFDDQLKESNFNEVPNFFDQRRRRGPIRPEMSMPKIEQEDEDDFDKFMNEHSISRKVLDKRMIANLKDMPPEIKAIILSNVFNKFDD